MNVLVVTWNIYNSNCSDRHWRPLEHIAEAQSSNGSTTVAILTECQGIGNMPEWSTDYKHCPERRIATFVGKGRLTEAALQIDGPEFRTWHWNLEGMPPTVLTGVHINQQDYLAKALKGLKSLANQAPDNPIIVAGDFNTNRAYENRPRRAKKAPTTDRFKAFEDCLEGPDKTNPWLRSAWHHANKQPFGGEPPTWRNTTKDGRPSLRNGVQRPNYMIDYIFTSRQFKIEHADVADLERPEVLKAGRWEISDHLAVWAKVSFQ
jgi:hypothetical protein